MRPWVHSGPTVWPTSCPGTKLTLTSLDTHVPSVWSSLWLWAPKPTLSFPPLVAAALGVEFCLRTRACVWVPRAVVAGAGTCVCSVWSVGHP